MLNLIIFGFLFGIG